MEYLFEHSGSGPIDDDGLVPVPPPPLPLAAAAPAAALPTGEALIYEPKLDGWRVCAHGPAGILHSRRFTDLSARFPDILAAVQRLSGGAVLDGELVAYRPGVGLEFVPLTYSARRRAKEGITLVLVATRDRSWFRHRITVLRAKSP